MNILFANNAASTISSSILASDTTFSVAAGQGGRFPPANGAGLYFYATLIDLSNNIEIIKVTNRVVDVLTVVRGQDGTTGLAFASGSRIEQRLPNIAIQDIVAAAIAQARSFAMSTVPGNVTLTSADIGTLKNVTAAADVTLPAASALGVGDAIRFKSSTEQKVRLLAAGSDTIDGDVEYQIPSYTTCEIAKSAAGAFVLTLKPNHIVGQLVPNTFVGNVAPRGYLFPGGAPVSRTTYGGLFYASSLTGTITVTIASPGVVTWTGNKLQNNDPIEFSTTGALPTGIVAGTTYYVRDYGVDGVGLFRLAATPGGTAINTTGSQSGVHTGLHVPYGRGDGSTTFNVVDVRASTPIARDALGGTAAGRVTVAASGVNGDTPGASGGEQAHTLTAAESAPHIHNLAGGSPVLSGGTVDLGIPGGGGTNSQVYGSGATDSFGGGAAHNNVQPVTVTSWLVKT
jgi:hypothetical protein